MEIMTFSIILNRGVHVIIYYSSGNEEKRVDHNVSANGCVFKKFTESNVVLISVKNRLMAIAVGEIEMKK